MDWFKFIAAGVGLVAGCLFAAALSVIPSNRELATIFFLLGAVGGMMVVILGLIRHANFKRVGSTMGNLLDEGRAFMTCFVALDGVGKWRSDIDAWYKRAERVIEEELSDADLALFRDITHGPSLSFGGTAEYQNTMDYLHRVVGNLNAVLTRFLEQRP